jgi:hypothetical protein
MLILLSELSIHISRIAVSHFLQNPQSIMCEERAPKLQIIPRSLAIRVPSVVVQRVEEIFPALREPMVSFVLDCTGKNVFVLIPGFTSPKKPIIL